MQQHLLELCVWLTQDIGVMRCKACICKGLTNPGADVYLLLSLWQHMLTLRLSSLV